MAAFSSSAAGPALLRLERFAGLAAEEDSRLWRSRLRGTTARREGAGEVEARDSVLTSALGLFLPAVGTKWKASAKDRESQRVDGSSRENRENRRYKSRDGCNVAS